MPYKELMFNVRGEAPLLMHNGQTSDPLNEFSKRMKQLSGKRVKTDDDHNEMAHVEWFAGLYLYDGKPCLPGFVIEATLISAARKSKRGQLAQAGIIVPDDALLVYDGPTELNELWNNKDFQLRIPVRIKQNRVVRTRPCFKKWSAEIKVVYDPSVLNEADVREIMNTAGSVGFCDWRPRFGRFVVL